MTLPQSVLHSTDTIAKWVQTDLLPLERIPQWTIQTYLKEPLLFDGRKMDIRVWAVVASIDPLRIYMLPFGFPRVSPRKYNASSMDPCQHTRLLQCGDVELSSHPHATTDPDFHKGIRLTSNQWRGVWRDIETQLVQVVMQARTSVLPLHNELRALFHKENGAPRGKRFAFLSPDFVVTSDRRAHLVEVNLNGYMLGDTLPLLFRTQLITEHALQLVGANQYPHSHRYQEEYSHKIQKFCDKYGPCADEEERVLWELVHERMHSCEWKLVYPDTRRFYSLIHSLEAIGKFSKTPLDRLLEAFLQHGENA